MESSILHTAIELTQGERAKIYGPPRENWAATVNIFNAMTGRDLSIDEGVKFAIAMKLARLKKTPNHTDSIVDLAGYSWVLNEVIAPPTEAK